MNCKATVKSGYPNYSLTQHFFAGQIDGVEEEIKPNDFRRCEIPTGPIRCGP
jgi:hypothetical protein